MIFSGTLSLVKASDFPPKLLRRETTATARPSAKGTGARLSDADAWLGRHARAIPGRASLSNQSVILLESRFSISVTGLFFDSRGMRFGPSVLALTTADPAGTKSGGRINSTPRLRPCEKRYGFSFLAGDPFPHRVNGFRAY